MIKATEARTFALALPGAEEREAWGEATFRVRGKIFLILSPGEEEAGIKATLEQQAALVATEPETFGIAHYTGRYGWITVRLETVDPEHFRELVVDAWRRTAPKRLAATYDATHPQSR